MKAFLAACVIAIVIAVAGAYVLNMYQQPVSVAFSTTGTRI
jgi:hypothetical protein